MRAAAFEPGRHPRVRIEFTEPVRPSPSAGDWVVRNVDTGAVVDPTDVSVTFDADSKRATVTVATLLPDGNYRVELQAGAATDLAGNALEANFAHDFFVLAGDADHDRAVGFTDLLALAKNYGKPGTWAQGDFNGDGKVDFADLLSLAKAYNKQLFAPPSPAPTTLPARSTTTNATLSDEDAAQPVFSTTPVLKPTAPAAKPKVVAQPVARPLQRPG